MSCPYPDCYLSLSDCSELSCSLANSREECRPYFNFEKRSTVKQLESCYCCLQTSRMEHDDCTCRSSSSRRIECSLFSFGQMVQKMLVMQYSTSSMEALIYLFCQTDLLVTSLEEKSSFSGWVTIWSLIMAVEIKINSYTS